MVEGELLTLERLGSMNLSVDEYFEIIERKTAHLFAAACSIPALIAPAHPGSEAALHAYGRKLGTCFQLVDDLLDFVATETEVGKPVLSDLREGKLTLPLILLLDRVGPAQRALIATVLEDRSFDRVAAEQILELVRSEGTLEEVDLLARTRAAEAQRDLAFFPAVPARAALEYAPDYILRRRF
jgi:octaprenyl-diphosphate synthase